MTPSVSNSVVAAVADGNIASEVRERNSQVNIVHFAATHHARHSGYHRLADYLAGHETLTWAGPHYGNWLNTRIYHRLIRPFCPLEHYSQAAFYTELSACVKAMRTKRSLFHFIYGENQ